jgi:NDP-sugar pyrophosphorylase family protein
MKRETTAFILAGGQGTRLRPYTYTIPKPLLPLGDRPILEFIIERLRTNGVLRIIISTGYKSRYIESFFGDGTQFGVGIHYVREQKPLGTCGPLSLARSMIDPAEYLVLMNGDIYTELDFSKFIAHARKADYELTVGYLCRTETSKFGVLSIEGGQIRGVIEKPSNTISVSSGIYVVKGSALRHVPDNQYFTVPDLISRLIEQNIPVGAYQIDDYWMGIEYVEDLNNVLKRLNIVAPE